LPYSHQHILNLAEICARKGVEQIVLSPGSRVAPLTLAFVRHSEIETFTISDERSASFVAMGMAQQTGKLVAIACTSGTAMLNYSPAIAEAFYQQIPLLVLTADRPPEWIDQQDGQAIRQQLVHQNHTKGSFQLPVETTHPDAQWHSERIISEAINLANRFPKGPVHVNVPIREPFYPKVDEVLEFGNPKVISEWESELNLTASAWEKVMEVWKSNQKIMLIGGQERQNEALCQSLQKLGVPIISDVISNLHSVVGAIKLQDAWLKASREDAESFQPDLLITFGKSVISKNLKLFLRKHKPKQHWHLQIGGEVADPFQSLTDILRIEPTCFFKEFVERIGLTQSNQKKEWLKTWQQTDQTALETANQFFEKERHNEFACVRKLMKQLPKNCLLHLANSMSVRYANFINLEAEQSGVEIFANRGTSGIDGSSSTAVGHAINSNQTNILITGDLSFFYDRNAFWHNYLPKSLKILLLNNGGGVIFRMIDGPARQPELGTYFETQQNLTAEYLAKDFGFGYQKIQQENEFEKGLSTFFSENEKPQILEVITNKEESGKVFRAFKGLF
jgi:2-succinyl-5-enolpyruvyl-6-hydroxy-3-cyclohexene-1-carboxylate synthase